jgi:cbb3-type cytochrome oxidase subunit 3
MSVIAIIVLFLGCFTYMFWPERNPFVQADKTRVDYLRERKDAIYENLRDLNFEYQAGKYPEAEYAEQRKALEDEAAAVIAEMEGLIARGMKSTRTRA